MPNFAVNYIASCACRLDKFQEDQEVVIVVIKHFSKKKALAEIHTLQTTIDYAHTHIHIETCRWG